MSWLDLHLHSAYSEDGEIPPGELVSICRARGVTTAAVADHNTTRGVEEARQAASAGMTLIPGIELDCLYEGTELHVLGYWIDPSHPGYEEVEDDILDQNRAATGQRIRMVRDLGIHVDRSRVMALSREGFATGETIVEAALGQPENDGNPLLLPYRPGGARADNPLVNFYWDYCSQGKPAFVPVEYMSLDRAVALIQESGGIAVLAHPGVNVKESIPLLDGIFSRGVVGMEVYSSYHTAAQTAFYREQALARGLAMSCGSDFHGKIKPAISCGGVDCGGMERELLDGLLKKHREAF